MNLNKIFRKEDLYKEAGFKTIAVVKPEGEKENDKTGIQKFM